MNKEMMFPKPVRKKKRMQHKTSILEYRKRNLLYMRQIIWRQEPEIHRVPPHHVWWWKEERFGKTRTYGTFM